MQELISLLLTAARDDEQFKALIVKIDDILSFIDSIWRLPDSHVADVLTAIGRLHPDSAVAKQARKSVIRHRSHLANLN